MERLILGIHHHWMPAQGLRFHIALSASISQHGFFMSGMMIVCQRLL
ncbi:hypothetical protein N9C31_01310 [Gammaproteobacteria bacterium]|nr:hypothetical protein [Gammaproteobacteria bacterium]